MASSSQTDLVNSAAESQSIQSSSSSSSSSPHGSASFQEGDNSIAKTVGSTAVVVMSENQQPYKMYRRRWIGMLVIISLNIATGFVWLTFNSVSKISEKWLNASLTEVNLSSMLYFAGSIATSSFSGYVFEKWGIKFALILGASLNVVGCTIRYFGSFIESTEDSHEARLTVILIGQFIAACAQPFFLNVSPKYSAVWFGDGSRAVATTIGTVSNPVGIACAMLVIPMLCSNEDGDDMPLTLLVVGIIAIATLIPTFFIPVKPPTPPSASAEIALAETREVSFMVALRTLSTNIQFWVLFLAFAISVAVFNVVTSLINQIVEPYNYSDDDAGIFGACFIAAGIVGAAASGVFVDRTRKYKEVLKSAAPLLAAGYVGFLFVVREDFFPWICLVCGFLGFISFALLPVALELGVETTYPAPTSACTSVLWLGGQTCAVVFLLVGDSLRGKSPFKDDPEDTMSTGLISIACVSTLVCFLAFFFHSPYHRMEAEAEAERLKKLGVAGDANNDIMG